MARSSAPDAREVPANIIKLEVKTEKWLARYNRARHFGLAAAVFCSVPFLFYSWRWQRALDQWKKELLSNG